MSNRDCLSFAALAAFVFVACKLFVLIGGAHG